MKSHKRLTLLALAVLGLSSQVVLADDTSHSTTNPMTSSTSSSTSNSTNTSASSSQASTETRQVQIVQANKKPSHLFPRKPNPINLYKLAG